MRIYLKFTDFLAKTENADLAAQSKHYTGAGHGFPDGSASAASNHCRNPTRESTGVWCYVGGTAGTDLCDVPGCSDDENGHSNSAADTLLIGGGGVHWMHVLPDWRGQSGLRMRLKRWAPGVYEGVSVHFRRAGRLLSYDVVQVGADGDEKIKLYRATRENGAKEAQTADEEIVYPHLLMASRWTELLFRFGDDDGEQSAAATVTMSTTAGGQIFSWALSNNSASGSGRRIAFVGLATITGRGHVATRFPTGEGTTKTSYSNV